MNWFIASTFVAALPWLAIPLVTLLRFRQSKSLDDYEPLRGANAPRLSVIIPARDEAHNIERCLGSALRTTYANVEIIVVDDHSSDGTGDIVRRMIAHDARARVTPPPPLPAGWFGKQWACAHGASLATGDVLLFTDADTWHAPDLYARSVSAMFARGADLLTVFGRQEAVSFWEMAGQPTVFFGLVALTGGTEPMSQTRDARRKAANGQCILVRRDAYDVVGGHEAVRGYVVEDVMMARRVAEAGRAVHAVMGVGQLSTRMYRGLGDFIQGWRKNIWAGGKFLVADRPSARALLRVALPLSPFIGLIPLVALGVGYGVWGVRWWGVFGAAGYVYETVMLAVFFRRYKIPVVSALLYPIGLLLVSYVAMLAVLRGDRTEWKGRTYVVG